MELYEQKEHVERVILVGIQTGDSDPAEASLDELGELAKTAGAVVVGRMIQNREQMHPATYIGKGKILELKEMIWETDATGIVCDDELSSAQLGNLEQELECKVVGKSETAIELVKRGHRLIADDAVEIKRNVTDRLVGTAPELIRHYIELRGIGVIDVCRLFGMSAVKDEAEIDMVINLEQWKDGAMYDRLGLENLYTTILDVQVPSLTVPVRPGRNLAVIIEVAAMNNRHKKMGYNAAVEFTKQINQHFDQAMSAQLNDN